MHASEALDRALNTEDPCEAIDYITTASVALNEALYEAMAAAVMTGLSMRKVAELARIAPNSVPPRLARTTTLSGYVQDGILTTDGIAAARFDASTGREPMTFTPRRKDPS